MRSAKDGASIVKRSKLKPPSPPQPLLRVSLRLGEIEDEAAAADLLSTILRVQAEEETGPAPTQKVDRQKSEVRDDAA